MFTRKGGKKNAFSNIWPTYLVLSNIRWTKNIFKGIYCHQKYNNWQRNVISGASGQLEGRKFTQHQG